jgi:hypothetical protein
VGGSRCEECSKPLLPPHSGSFSQGRSLPRWPLERTALPYDFADAAPLKLKVELEDIHISQNRLVELELAGAVRYTQYSLMIFGHARIFVTACTMLRSPLFDLYIAPRAQDPRKSLAASGMFVEQLRGTRNPCPCNSEV